MATYTAGDQINRALRLLGVLAEGETPSAETSADALTALNQMIDSWNTERLSVYATLEQTVTWPSGQATRTLGPTGNIVGTRPVQVLESTFYRVGGVDYPLTLVNETQYNGVTDKTLTGYPTYLLVNPTHPNAEMTLYPVPDRPLEVHVVSVSPLTEITSLTTELTLPPGYLRAFAYNLAMELAPEFGAEPSLQVQRIAMTSKRNLRRLNTPNDVLELPSVLTIKHHGYNIEEG